MVRFLLAADNTLVDSQDRSGEDLVVVSNTITPPACRYGNTALHYSCEEERTEVAKLLISHGASRELVNREEKTALEMAGPAFARTLKN